MKVPGERLFLSLPTGLRDSVGAAVLLSAAVHVGAIAWGVSGAAERTMAVVSGAATAIEVTLVEGPTDGATGDNAAAPSRAKAVPVLAAEPVPKAPPAEVATDRAVSADRVPQPSVTSDAPETSALPPDPHAAPVPPPKPSPPVDATAETPETAHPVTPLTAAPLLAALPGAGPAGQPPVDSTPAATTGGGAPGASGGGTEGAAPQADNPAPAYPFAARRRGQEGRVVLSVEVLPTGDAGTISVERSSGVASLDRAATDAVRRWRFRPARRDGRAVRATVQVPVRFALK